MHWQKPAPLFSRRNCLGVDERIDARGNIVRPLEDEALEDVGDRLAARMAIEPIGAVAVCLLFSYLDSSHELRLADYLAARRIGKLEIKKRGVDVVPDVLRKQLRLRGDGAATVILTRLAGRHSALIVRRRAAQGTMDA